MNEDKILKLLHGNKTTYRRLKRAAGKDASEESMIKLVAEELEMDEEDVWNAYRPKRQREEDDMAMICMFLNTLRSKDAELRAHTQNKALELLHFGKGNVKVTYGITQRCAMLGLTIPKNGACAMGHRVSSAYMEHYKKHPFQRVFIKADGTFDMMCAYTLDECFELVDDILKDEDVFSDL